MTATLIYSTGTGSAREAALISIARVAAAGRVQADRIAREERARRERERVEAAAFNWIDSIRRDGATQVGIKHCSDFGKYRTVLTLSGALDYLTVHAGEDIEAWGVRPDGEYCADVW